MTDKPILLPTLRQVSRDTLQDQVYRQIREALMSGRFQQGHSRAWPAGPVGASMLAMVDNENTGCVIPHGVCAAIASMLAPTEVLRWAIPAFGRRVL